MPPGKLAPKLFQDLLFFDPIKGKPNILAEHTNPVGDGPQLAPLPGSCRHDYTVKTEQSVSPPLDLRPDGTTHYKVAVICRRCRIHATIAIDYSNSIDACPGSDHPLHHFVRFPAYDSVTSNRIQYAWQCSVPVCHANLFVKFKLPCLSDEDLDLLTNTELLKKRYEELVRQDPGREGIRQASPMDACARLRRYVKDSLNPNQTRRQFPSNNKRFQEAFGLNGVDCAEVLGTLGFRYSEANWELPDPAPVSDRLTADGHTLREQCEDVVFELLACMYRLSSTTGTVNPAAAEGWPSAERDLERILAAQSYSRHNSMLHSSSVNEDIPYFSSLGALPEFSDTVIEYAYDRQVLCDPEQQGYYFECLQVITERRNTEQLQMKVATLQSTGMCSRRDLRAAYRYLRISQAEAENISDQRIIELFHAQQPDLSVSAQEEARTALYKIGVARQSSLLLNASQQTVDTYDNALAWLGNGVDRNTSDEGLLAVVAMKAAEGSSNDNIAQKAIATIAKARQSNMLNNWLLTGRTDAWTMSTDEALRHLNIEQPFDSIDQTILPALFDSARLDRPGEMTNKAIATIEQAIAGGAGTAVRAPETWPVGLTSHGNTCYLNSLLQYYFSIRPLRDIILSYDNYKLDTSTYTEKQERVGQRKISMVEIKGGQRFADDLKELFERMIRSPDSAVRPDEDLVCRAFLEPKDYALLASGIREEAMAQSKTEGLVNGSTSAIDDKITEVDMVESPTAAPKSSETSGSALPASQNNDQHDLPTPPTSPDLKGVAQLPPEHAPPLPPRRFSTTKEEALSKAQSNARQQQDVTEVHDGIMFRLRSGMMPRDKDANEEQEDALRDLFSIGIIETVINRGVPQKPKDLTDTSIQLDVPYEATDIYSALDAVFDLQAYAENPALTTFKSIRSLPPLLQINIPRIGFDMNRAGGAVYKSNECVRLTDDLYLDRYCEDHQQQLFPLRKQCWAWRKQLRDYRREQKVLSDTPSDLDLDGPSTVGETARYFTALDEVNNHIRDVGVEPIEADGEITDALMSDAQEQSKRLSALDSQIDELKRKLDQQFINHQEVKYRLAAVFFHRGGHGHGHYWIYIHDFQNDLWRSYNDERVEEFKKMEDIFEAKTWQQGTPTYAVYVKMGQMDLIQAVCRAPEKAPTPEYAPAPPLETEDVQMNQGASQEGQVLVGIDPQLLQQGGQTSWDDTPQAAEARW